MFILNAKRRSYLLVSHAGQTLTRGESQFVSRYEFLSVLRPCVQAKVQQWSIAHWEVLYNRMVQHTLPRAL